MTKDDYVQVIVQRALASKDMSHAKGACVLAGWLKVYLIYRMMMKIDSERNFNKKKTCYGGIWGRSKSFVC